MAATKKMEPRINTNEHKLKQIKRFDHEVTEEHEENKKRFIRGSTDLTEVGLRRLRGFKSQLKKLKVGLAIFQYKLM